MTDKQKFAYARKDLLIAIKKSKTLDQLILNMKALYTQWTGINADTLSSKGNKFMDQPIVTQKVPTPATSPSPPLQTIPPPTVQTPPEKAGKTIRCPHCNELINYSEDIIFCPNCGVPID